MFVITMISPTGFPVAMGIYDTMKDATDSVLMSGDKGGPFSMINGSDWYCEGTIQVDGAEHKWSIVQVIPSKEPHSVFES